MASRGVSVSTRNPGAAKFSLPGIQGVAGNSRPLFVHLSPFTQALILSALDDASNMRNWRGADYWLSQAEAEIAQAAVSAAQLEVMIPMFTGALVPYFGSVDPEWGLICDGRTFQRADYPELWELSPAAYKNATAFTLPTLAGRTMIGAGQGYQTGYYAPWSWGGVEQVTLTEAQIPAHSHSYQGVIPNVDLESPGVPDIVAAGINPLPQQTGLSGGGQSHTNMQPYAAFYYVVITPKP